jgi:D-alanyl-D-alanine carboxypeptidase
MMYAVQNEDFMVLISARSYTATTGDVSNSINRGWEFIPDLFGGKTGYDDDTGYCLVEVGRRGDVSLISVTIDGVAPDIWYMDHALLQEYGFAAREDRIASGAPVSDNRVAYAQLSEQAVAQAETDSADGADEAVLEEPETVLVSADTAPRPILVSGGTESGPVPRISAESGHAFDNWGAGLVIVAIVATSLLMNSGISLRTWPLGTNSSSGIDTQA